MKIVHLRMLLLSAYLSTALVTSSASASSPREERTEQELVKRVGGFEAVAFVFKVARADDGKDAGGGWQEASTQLQFDDARDGTLHTWTCSIVVGMPVRSEKGGTVSPDEAAKATAKSANSASDLVMPLSQEWLPADFCIKFGAALQPLLNAQRKIFGARVQRSSAP